MIGPGKYDTYIKDILKELNAELALLIVLKGDLGTGASLASRGPALDNLLILPSALRKIADCIEKDYLKVTGE